MLRVTLNVDETGDEFDSTKIIIILYLHVPLGLVQSPV